MRRVSEECEKDCSVLEQEHTSIPYVYSFPWHPKRTSPRPYRNMTFLLSGRMLLGERTPPASPFQFLPCHEVLSHACTADRFAMCLLPWYQLCGTVWFACYVYATILFDPRKLVLRLKDRLHLCRSRADMTLGEDASSRLLFVGRKRDVAGIGQCIESFETESVPTHSKSVDSNEESDEKVARRSYLNK